MLVFFFVVKSIGLAADHAGTYLGPTDLLLFSPLSKVLDALSIDLTILDLSLALLSSSRVVPAL